MRANDDSIAIIRGIQSKTTASPCSVSTTSAISTQIDSSMTSYEQKSSKEAESDAWLSNVTRVYADSVKSDPTVDSTSLINVYWDIYKLTFKALISNGTDMDALKDVSFLFNFLRINRFYYDIIGFRSAI